MNNQQFFQTIQNFKDKNLQEILDEYEKAKQIYEKMLNAAAFSKRRKLRGTYSKSLEKKDYYANISTTAQ